MSAPPWGHKPPAVADRDAYWGAAPPTPSPRLAYWLRRLDEGSWHPNKYFRRQGYDGSAGWAGVYVWEYLHVLAPAITADAWASAETLPPYNPAFIEQETRRLDVLLSDYDLQRLRARFLAATVLAMKADPNRILMGLTERAADGLECPVCGKSADYPFRPPTMPVGRSESGAQVFACVGACAAVIARRQRG